MSEQPAVVTIEVPGGGVRLISGRLGSLGGVLAVLRQQGRTLDIRRAAAGWTPEQLMELLPPARHPATVSEVPSVTLAICTLGSHPRLPDAVRAAVEQRLPARRVMVVDNDPTSGAVRRALGEDLLSRVVMVEEPRRGLSRARNAALEATDTDFLAFTDDDAILEVDAVERLIEPFSQDEQVGAVTGLVLPAELRTAAQSCFEAYVGFGKGVEPAYWALDPKLEQRMAGAPGQRGVLFPWTTGKVGSGNNMAFRVSVLREMDGFDVRLGAGTVAQGGEDLDAFTRVLLSGHVIAYTPDALVWHYHRETMDGLEKQVLGNGVGMGAVLTKSALAHPRAVLSMAGGAVSVARKALTSRGTYEMPSVEGLPRGLRRRLLRREIWGLAQGPWKYCRSSLHQ